MYFRFLMCTKTTFWLNLTFELHPCLAWYDIVPFSFRQKDVENKSLVKEAQINKCMRTTEQLRARVYVHSVTAAPTIQKKTPTLLLHHPGRHDSTALLVWTETEDVEKKKRQRQSANSCLSGVSQYYRPENIWYCYMILKWPNCKQMDLLLDTLL